MSHLPYSAGPLHHVESKGREDCQEFLSFESCPELVENDSRYCPLSLQPLLFMDLLDERTLVAVERPLDDIIAQLPPPIKKKKFGT